MSLNNLKDKHVVIGIPHYKEVPPEFAMKVVKAARYLGQIGVKCDVVWRKGALVYKQRNDISRQRHYRRYLYNERWEEASCVLQKQSRDRRQLYGRHIDFVYTKESTPSGWYWYWFYAHKYESIKAYVGRRSS
jgi:hypothetical protein